MMIDIEDRFFCTFNCSRCCPDEYSCLPRTICTPESFAMHGNVSFLFDSDLSETLFESFVGSRPYTSAEQIFSAIAEMDCLFSGNSTGKLEELHLYPCETVVRAFLRISLETVE